MNSLERNSELQLSLTKITMLVNVPEVLSKYKVQETVSASKAEIISYPFYNLSY